MTGVEAVHAAWNDAGVNPLFHRNRMRSLRMSWPVLAKALDALVPSDSVPHDVDCEAEYVVGATAWTPCGCDERRVATAQRERDEARAERDALAHVIDEARRIVGTADLREFIDEAPAVSLARHDAEVKAQALDEAREAISTKPAMLALPERFLAARAAEIREAAGS